MYMADFEYTFTKFNVGNKKEIAALVKKFDLPVVPGTEAYIDWHRKDIPLKTWDYITFIFGKLPKDMMKLDNLLTVLELRYMGLQSSEKNIHKITNEKFRKVLEKEIPVAKRETLDIIDEVLITKQNREEEAHKNFLDECFI